MYLTNTTETLQVILAGTVATNQSVVTVDYGENTATTFVAGKQRSTTNGATAVNILNAPAASTQRIVQLLTMTNQDTAPITVTIRTNDGGTLGVQFGPVTLHVGERIQFATDTGFTVYTVTGAVKVTAVQSTVEPGYIDGNKLTWISGTSFRVSSGACYIPSVGANVVDLLDITRAGLSLSASTFYHVYRFLNSGIPDIEHVTTAPSSPYNGTARTKTGDTTRRYLGSFLTDGSGNIIDFEMSPETCFVQYRKALTNAAPFRVLSAGGAVTPTNVSLSGIVPTTAVTGYFRGVNTSTASGIFFYVNSTYAAADIMGNVQQAPAGTTFTADLIMSCPAQNIAYSVVSGTGAFLDVKGYWFER